MPDFMGLKLSGAPEKEPARFPGAEISAVVATPEASVRSLMFVAELLIQAPVSQAVKPAKAFWLLIVFPALRLMLMTPWPDKGGRAAIVAKRRIEQIRGGALFVMELFRSCLVVFNEFSVEGRRALSRFDLE